MQSPGRFEQLRSAYDEAFHHLCLELRSLECCQELGDMRSCDRFLERVAHAEREYRRKRDALAEYIMCRQAQAAA